MVLRLDSHEEFVMGFDQNGLQGVMGYMLKVFNDFWKANGHPPIDFVLGSDIYDAFVSRLECLERFAPATPTGQGPIPVTMRFKTVRVTRHFMPGWTIWINTGGQNI